jgi:hypothetical protein
MHGENNINWIIVMSVYSASVRIDVCNISGNPKNLSMHYCSVFCVLWIGPKFGYVYRWPYQLEFANQLNCCSRT